MKRRIKAPVCSNIKHKDIGKANHLNYKGDYTVKERANIAIDSLNGTYHGGHGKIALVHLFGQPVDLPACVAKDDGLEDKR